MASSLGSAIAITQALLLIGVCVFLLLRYYLPFRRTPAYVIVPIFLALALPASIVLLVPIDLASSPQVEKEKLKGIWLSQRVVLVSWRISYWLTFALTWVLLPLIGEYVDAGYRDSKSRMLYSLRSNARYQLIVLGCAFAGLLYIVISKGFNFTDIKGLLMALAYLWGLLLSIYLMGHGLVAVPRRIFRDSDIAGRLRRTQSRAPGIHEKLEDAVMALEETEAQVASLKLRKTGTAREYGDWIDELVEMTHLPGSRSAVPPVDRDAAATVPAIITERYMADLTRKLERDQHRHAQYVAEWDGIIQNASEVQAILDSRASKSLVFGSTSNRSILSGLSILTPYLRYHLHVHLLPYLRLAISLLLAAASVAIVWSELIKFPAPHLSAVSLTVVHHPSDKSYKVGLGGQIIAAAWICYMCACALISVKDVPVWYQRALVRRNTSAESACWYAGQIAKLTVPLAYNFLTFLPKHIHESTTFYHFLGRFINFTPLGSSFDSLLPVLILIPACATLFNLYGKVKNVFGFDILETDEDGEGVSAFGTGGWREGKDLIARDLAGGRTRISNSVGLADSPRPSLDARPHRSAPAPWPSSTNPSSTRTTLPPSRNPQLGAAQEDALPSSSRRRQRNVELEPESDEENIFTLFGKRVKNTFDNIETPNWMQTSSNNPGARSQSGALFKKPRWMADEGEEAGSSRRSGLGRLFAGLGTGEADEAGTGRVRL